MRVTIFCHSLLSDWNHGNAHFLRGVASELISRGHDVVVYEPRDAWSLQNLIADHGDQVLQAPGVARLEDADLVAAGEELGGHAAQEVRVAVVPVGAQRMAEDRHAHAGSSVARAAKRGASCA